MSLNDLRPETLIPADGPAGDRLALMHTFVTIVEAGNLSAAARRLGATQPTISRRLQALERALGVRLIQRSTQSMRLTVDGQRCYERVTQLLASWAEFEADLRGARDEPEGVLRVVVAHAFGQARMIEPLAAYLRRYPRMQVEWLLHGDRAIDDYIAAGVDCAIQVGEITDPGLVVLPLSQVPRIAVAAPEVLAGRPMPETPEALAALPWLALRGYYRREVVLYPCAGGPAGSAPGEVRFAINPRMTTDNLYALRTAALAGLGACIASRWVLADDLAQGRLVQLTPAWEAASLPVNLVYPYARFYPARLRRFVEIMREQVPAVLGV